jgi:O-Antigen ligase
MSARALEGATATGRSPAFRISVASVQQAVLWAFIACSCVAIVEPSPYEFMFVLAAIAFARSGLRFDRAMIPMIVTLAMFNAGGLLALVPWVGERESVTFIAISIYVAITAIFFAAMIANDAVRCMRTIRSGYVLAGVIAASLGILGYFNVGGLGDYFTVYGNLRASGPFKDPNVFGPFLVAPIVWLTQDILLKRGAGFFRGLAPLLIMLLGLLLSFSRGAWGAAGASVFLLIAFTFLTTSSAALRQRIVVVSVLGAIAFAALMAVALSIPAIRDVFLARASLNQDYDLGELGRFGAQARSIPMLLERPFGFGPLRYDTIFPTAPHEVYINAFSSYGWLGGLSFVAFTGITLYIGFKVVFERSSLRTEAVAIWASLLPQMVQGFQIDTDHWRHLYLMFGCMYGFAAAARIERQRLRLQTTRPNGGAPAPSDRR